MRFLPTLLAATSLFFAACGGGGGGGNKNGNEQQDEVVALRLDAIAPLTGPVAGGQPVVLSGDGFLDGASPVTSVKIGNAELQDLVIVSDERIEGRTPPGFVGPVDVRVLKVDEQAELTDGYTYMPPPQILQVQAQATRSGIPAGLTTGGTRILVIGHRFALNAGVTRVFVGGVEATDVTVQDDSILEATTPANFPGIVNVSVRNDNGEASLSSAFFYRAPLLYAADGKGVSGRLYLINAANGQATPIGSGIGFRVDGLAMSDDGTLFGVTQESSPATSRLITINTTTGVGTVLRELRTDTNGRVDMVDIAFRDGVLYGFAHNFRRACEIDIATGTVHLFDFVDFGGGEAIAADADGNVFLAPQDDDDDLWSLDIVSGAADVLVALSGNQPNSFFNAMTFLDGALYASDARRNGTNNTEPSGVSKLVKVNPVTGTVDLVGSLPDDIDALTANFN